MPTIVTAADNDTLCTLGINNGFNDCLPLRALPANAAFLTRALVAGDQVTIPDLNISDNDKPTDAEHKFQIKGRQVAIRYVHGSSSLPYDQDLDLTELNISNFTTDRAGINQQVAFPPATQQHFDANADIDTDAFKVEVMDSRPPSARLEVIVEPLLPVLDAGGAISDHTVFPGDPKNGSTVRGFRALVTHALKVTDKRFRTPYLRLVVDDIDAASRTQQTVLVTDNVANGDPKIEVLDQDIRATYILPDCPASPDASKCRVETTAQQNRGQFVDLALHVLRATPTGKIETTPGGPADDGIVKLADVQTRIDTFARRHWAQDLVKFKVVLKRTVDLPSNMLTVGDLTGNLASGVSPAGPQGQFGFTLLVARFGVAPDTTHVVPPVPVNSGDDPATTAGNLITAINRIPGLTATLSVNPAEVRGPIPAGGAVPPGSADILITDSNSGRITITNPTADLNQDSAQLVSISNLSLNVHHRNGLANYHVGHPNQRNLYKMLDTGDTRIDLFVIDSFPDDSHLLGLTMVRQTDLDARRRPMTGMMNTVVVRANTADGTDNQRFVIAHEIGHALLDCGLHADSNRQLMFATAIDTGAVTDPKRLIALDPPATNWENLVTRADLTLNTQRIRMNTLTRLSEKSSDLMHS